MNGLSVRNVLVRHPAIGFQTVVLSFEQSATLQLLFLDMLKDSHG